MLKYLFFILFFAVMLADYFSMDIQTETPYSDGLIGFPCLHRITR